MLNFKGAMRNSDVFSKTFQLISITGFLALVSLAFWTLAVKGRMPEIDGLKALQVVQSLGVFILPSLVLAYFWSQSTWSFLALNVKLRWMDGLVVVLFMVLIIPFVNLLSEWNQQVVFPEALAWLEADLRFAETQAAQLSERLLNTSTFTGLAFNVLLIAVLPALGEELFFRRSVFSIVEQWRGVVVAIWLSAFIFSAIHFQFYGFVPRMLLGALMGYLYVWSGTLWLPILAHFVNNFIAVVFFFLLNNGYSVVDLNTIGTADSAWLGYLSAVVAFMGVYGLRIVLKRN